MQRRGPASLRGGVAALLFGGSFLLAAFSVEARGYALLVAFSLWAWLALRRSLEAPGALALASAWAAIVLGTLSQFLFVGTYAALVLVTAIDLVSRSQERGPRVRRALLLHAVPCAFLALLYFVSLRHVVNSGAPPWSWHEVALQTAAWGLALPSHMASVWVAAAIVVLVLVLDFRLHDGRTLAERAFTPIVVLVVPALLILFLVNEYVAPRYFLVNLAFLYLAAARVLGRAFERGGAARLAAVALVSAFLVGSVLDLRRFTRLGRGPYRETVELLAAEDSTPVLHVTGTPDFDVRALLEYHARFLSPERRIAYVSGREIPRGGVEWAIVDRPHFTDPPPPVMSIGPLTYTLRLFRPRYGPIGSEWALYRRLR